MATFCTKHIENRKIFLNHCSPINPFACKHVIIFYIIYKYVNGVLGPGGNSITQP